MDFFLNLFSTKVAYASLNSFLTNVNREITTPLIKLLFALAVVYFLWGMFEFIMSQQNEEKKTSGKEHMMWGVIGITIMMAVWGILSLIINTFGIEGIDPKQGTVNLPNYTPPTPNNLNQ